MNLSDVTDVFSILGNKLRKITKIFEIPSKAEVSKPLKYLRNSFSDRLDPFARRQGVADRSITDMIDGSGRSPLPPQIRRLLVYVMTSGKRGIKAAFVKRPLALESRRL
jgi:hypothetical protein